MKPVAIAIPLHRIPLARDEEFSLSRLRSVLGGHPRFFVCPAGLQLPPDFLRGEQVLRFPARFFTYPYGYNRLLMSSRFYRSFRRFSHLLVYQLDCLVFRDELNSWCSRDFDYIGSPWLDAYSGLAGEEPAWRVGNGGFSLRKVSTCLAVLSKRIERGKYFAVPPVHMPQPGIFGWLITNVQRRIRQHFRLWTVEDELENFGENEDRFWALEVFKIQPGYKKPNVDEAFRFGFETDPQSCLERTQGKLPFGCHAWAKHDREFWERAMAGCD